MILYLETMWYNKRMKTTNTNVEKITLKANKGLKDIIIMALIFNLVFIICLVLCCVFGFHAPYFALFITALMFAYHIDVRLIIGFLISKFVKPKINVHKKCFAITENEYRRLEKFGVKNWKDKFLTVFKHQFVIQDIKNKQNIEYVLRNNISAEIIHWVCFFVGLLAILIGCLLSISEWYIYVITAILASLLADVPPILIQRYNRYRVLKIAKRLQD